MDTSRLTFVWCATGEQRFLDEASRSCRSVKAIHPSAEAILFTDRLGRLPDFDSVVELPDAVRCYRDKIRAIQRNGRDRFVFLDTDTIVVGDLSPLFALLDRFDVAAAIENMRIVTPMAGPPSSFPELNTGVIAVRRRPWLDEFCDEWYRRTERYRVDQAGFRELLWEREICFHSLSPEWNLMFDAGDRVVGQVRVVHGHPKAIEYVAGRINRAGIYPLTNDLRPRYFKGEGAGWPWVRRNWRVATNYFKASLHRRGILTGWKQR